MGTWIVQKRIERMAIVFSLCGALLVRLLGGIARAEDGRALNLEGWQSLEIGLDLGDFRAHILSDVGDSRITVLRIDPERFRLVLANASTMPDLRTRTAREWASDKGLVAAINASMYREDHRTSLGLMRGASHINNAVLTKDKAVLAFDPMSDAVASVQIIDRDCQDFDTLRPQYGTLVQSIRMVDCHQQNVWGQQPTKWSTAAIGIDKSGRVLFLFTRSPYSTHNFIEILLRLPIDLYNAMYVEGGPEAQLYVNAGGVEVEKFGSFETGFFESDENDQAWPVPNIIGVVRLNDK